MKCEQCGNEHNGSYGTGRFCSKECRGAYAHSCERKHQKGTPWICDQCGEEFKSRGLMYKHKHEAHESKRCWNKGLTKETDPRVAKGVETIKKRISEGLVKNHWEGNHLPDEIRKKISASMKKAHTEGRAHNIGESRWNNEPSWPEKWFMQVIENEFTDKNYVREKPFHRFSLDFAWEHKKKCIEIDGQQHELLPGYKERDLRKDKALADEGWQVLRLPWSDVFNEPKKYIQLAKQFIDE